ncbi:MAG: hypothetical protein L6Q99_00840 [Planctomycetes bacterium]|nr:hypothetical protein [Planctomycetota bacterium]
MLRTSVLLRALPVVTALSLSSCIFVADGYRDAQGNWHSRDGDIEIRVGDGAEKSASADASGAPTEKDDEKAQALDDKAFELALARVDLELAKLSAGVAKSEATAGLARAERERADAVKALDQFKNVEMPLRVKDGELDVEEARFGIELKKIELEELIAMYKGDTMAASTKEIVVKRETKELEFMQRRLAMAETRFSALTGHELPHELANKEDEVRKAEEALAKANVEAQKAELETKKSLDEAERKIRTLERELAKLGAQSAKLETERAKLEPERAKLEPESAKP